MSSKNPVKKFAPVWMILCISTIIWGDFLMIKGKTKEPDAERMLKTCEDMGGKIIGDTYGCTEKWKDGMFVEKCKVYKHCQILEE